MAELLCSHYTPLSHRAPSTLWFSLVLFCHFQFGFGDFWPKSRSVVFDCIIATEGGRRDMAEEVACGFHGNRWLQTVGKSFKTVEKLEPHGEFALKYTRRRNTYWFERLFYWWRRAEHGYSQATASVSTFNAVFRLNVDINLANNEKYANYIVWIAFKKLP